MRVRCIALYIDCLLYNPLYRLYIEILLCLAPPPGLTPPRF